MISKTSNGKRAYGRSAHPAVISSFAHRVSPVKRDMQGTHFVPEVLESGSAPRPAGQLRVQSTAPPFPARINTHLSDTEWSSKREVDEGC